MTATASTFTSQSPAWVAASLQGTFSHMMGPRPKDGGKSNPHSESESQCLGPIDDVESRGESGDYRGDNKASNKLDESTRVALSCRMQLRRKPDSASQAACRMRRSTPN
jgi:hypothetical protein